MIRVGRITYENNKKIIPFHPDFKVIEVMTQSTQYSSLSPYSLSDNKGRILENLWQFSKVYKEVPASIQRYSRYDNKVIWQHSAEKHVDEKEELTKEYWRWRNKGFNNKYAVRYPVGYNNRHKCLYSIWNKKKLDYISARFEIYIPLYLDMVKTKPQFLELKELLKQGQNLLIVEVDGPHFESLEYYKTNYNVNDDFITENNTVLINEDSLNIFANEPKHSNGHRYCLVLALLD